VFSLNYDFHLSAGDNGDVFGITNNKDTSRNQTFAYDALNRLVSAQNAGTDCSQKTLNSNQTKFWGNNYSYDAWGNLLSKTPSKCSAENISLTALANNQLFGYGYDTAGNMTHDATSGLNYSYDQENRIAGAGGFAYTYDAEGNRVEKSNGLTGTQYWYMSLGIVAESDLSGNLQSEYVFFDGERVARRDFPSGAVSYYFSDHLKTTDIVTDAQGNIKNESDFYPWGGELQFLANDSNHYKFTGKEWDTETGLDYFGARYYSNGLGRFITPDWSATPVPVPYADLSDPQTLCQYCYVRGLPTTRYDADGHDGLLDTIKATIQDLGTAASNTVNGAGVGFIALVTDPGSVASGIGDSLKLAGHAYFTSEGRAQLGAQLSQDESTTRQVIFEGIMSGGMALAPGAKGEGAGIQTLGDLTPNTTAPRLPQDMNVNPTPPAANNGNGTVGPSPTQNAAVQADLAAAKAAGHTDIRVNEQQVNAQGQRCGICRPDLQTTDTNGVRHYTEYDRSAQNAAAHNARTQANDPNGVTHTNVGP
jgi:RHS repeat-associated protein